MSRVQWFSRSIALAAAALLLAGCPSIREPSEPLPSVDRADQLLQQGNPAAAARIYETLAGQNAGAERSSYLLRAAKAFLTARQPEEAARVLATLPQTPLPADQSFERQMLGVELALSRGQAPTAWQQIATVPEPKDAPAAPRYLDVKRRAAFAVGRPLDAVRAHVAEERYITNAEQLREKRAALLGELRDLSERGVRVNPSAAQDPLTRGWLELAAIAAASARNPSGATADVNAWRNRYPSHPANEAVSSELLGQPAPQQQVAQEGPIQAADHIALLLPLTGRQASAAITIRDGFLTSYYLSPAAMRPRVRIYDTATMSAADAIARATQEGAQFIVGPLLRDEVNAVGDLASKRPPVLALNFLSPDRSVPAGFYQFALSPEDEARQTARRILADGARRGIAIVPEGEWGNRILTAFREEYEAGGGALVDTIAFDATQTDYAQPLTQVLRITDSRARHKRLESVLGTKLQFEPRRRGDIGFIFAASQAQTARLLRPQLKFHFAGGIPTYATSDSFEPDPNANQDMDGLIFPDMPWMLGSSLAEAVRTSTREAWPSGGPRRNRLFAFGFDAYKLLTALRNQLPGSPVAVEGLTGQLSLDADRKVRRELSWAQIQQGQPRVLPPPPSSLEPAPAAASSLVN